VNDWPELAQTLSSCPLRAPHSSFLLVIYLDETRVVLMSVTSYWRVTADSSQLGSAIRPGNDFELEMRCSALQHHCEPLCVRMPLLLFYNRVFSESSVCMPTRIPCHFPWPVLTSKLCRCSVLKSRNTVKFHAICMSIQPSGFEAARKSFTPVSLSCHLMPVADCNLRVMIISV
jgi:hypothetical protein